MADKKVSISNILGSQIPDFIQSESPLFKEFLEQYYASEEHEYGTTYLADNLDDLKDISKLSGVIYAAVPVVLTEDAYHLDEVINVNTTEGFPDTYGLIKIDNEIITYTGKTLTSFTGCVRGFSGISKIESSNNPEFLTFSDTEIDYHYSGTSVENLSLLFVEKFYNKFKYQFLPGLENRNFENLSFENILSRAKDFYSSKGTDTAVKILFNVLFAKNATVIRPFDNTIVSSDAYWSKFPSLTVETIEGNPKNLESTTIFQGSTESPTATAVVSRVEEKFVGTKRYYRLFVSQGTLSNKFNVSKKTKVLGTTNSTSVVTVDSTVGFPDSGIFYYQTSEGNYASVEYQSKSYNQFFGCSGLSDPLEESTEIIDDNFIYGNENFDLTQICQMRIIGSIQGLSENSKNSQYFKKGDLISLKYFGEKPSLENKKYNSWFYNNVYELDIENLDISTSTVTTSAKHFLHVGDVVDILIKDTKQVAASDLEVTSILSKNAFKIQSGSFQSGVKYIAKKKLLYSNSNLIDTPLLANIQNSFSDLEENIYVSFSGLPSYSSIETSDRSKTFRFSDVDTSTGIVTINQHQFLNGDRVYFEVTSGSNYVTDGFYYIKKITVNTFKLSSSLPSIYSNFSVDFSGISSVDEFKITPFSLYQKVLQNQNHLKRILKNPRAKKEDRIISDEIGTLLNGIELKSPVSSDSYFYGQIESINIIDDGNDFDVLNPPDIQIIDDSGSGANAHLNLDGELVDVVLTSGGFNYAENPVVKVIGGNGSGAVCESKLRGYYHQESFTDFQVNLVTNIIELPEPHKFLDGEEVVYLNTGNSIGIGSTNVGFSTDRLSKNSLYYIAKQSDTSFSLAATKDRALSKTKLIDLNAYGNGDHTLKSRELRKIIDRISVINPGEGYKNTKIEVDSQSYPQSNRKNLFTQFVGINTHDNYIYARNHNFRSGDQVVYSISSGGSAISGLSTSNYYIVTVIDDHKFKLSEAGTASSITSVNYDRKIYSEINDIGSGSHTFKYPEIQVSIDGLVSLGSTTVIPSYYQASAYPVVRGSIDSVFIKSGGIGYGVTDIINYSRTPAIKILTGKEADLRAVVDSTGKLSSIYISNGGSEYTTPPTLVVEGSGISASLRANISNGVITSVDILDAGKKYKQNDTKIRVIPTGSNGRLGAELHEWKINDVKRYQNILSDLNVHTIQKKAPIPSLGSKLVSFYPARFYRSLLNDNVVDTQSGYIEATSNLNHSPIIGWAYDGNPIYGPYGNGKAIPDASGTGGIKKIYSSYSIDQVITPGLRPPVPAGDLVQDYLYDSSGDLDEYNGRYIVNSDFPNGTYAYFCTLDVSDNFAYPYTTFMHRNESDGFNYDLTKNQLDATINDGNYKRNVSHLGINDVFRNYPFVSPAVESNPEVEVTYSKPSGITSLDIVDPGSSYKVGDLINFNTPEISASVKEIKGKGIYSIQSTDYTYENVVFSINGNKVTGITTSSNNFIDGDRLEISGISSSLYIDLEGIKKVGVSTVESLLSVSLGTTSITGINTHLTLTESPRSRKFRKNDLIQIGSELILITDLDLVNNRYKVLREQNGSTSSSHTENTQVTKIQKEFSFEIDKKLQNKNVETGYIQYFNSLQSVGIGTSYSSVTVGFAGSTQIVKSIPPRAIYLNDHKFETGDELRYVSYGGSITASATNSLSDTFRLDEFDKLYCVKINDEYIGVSTQKVGFTTNYVYFDAATDTSHSFEVIKTNLTGIVKKKLITVTLNEQHSLKNNDEISLRVTPKRTQNYNFIFNDSARKLVVNSVSFASTYISVGSTDSSIFIENHGLETGDLVVYTNNIGIATPLQNNETYYVIKISDSRIKLAKNSYDYKKYPYSYIGITTFGSGLHEISKVNPKLEFYKGNTVSIGVSDVSLIDYDVNFYLDDKFKARYNSSLITKTGVFGDLNPNTKININVTDDLPKTLFYRLEGKNNNYTNTFPSSINAEVNENSTIKVLDSKYNNSHIISGIGSTTFDFNFVGFAETTSYTSSNVNDVFYYTKSTNDSGPIYSTKIIEYGRNVAEFPFVTSIGSTSGSDASISANSFDIGRIVDTKVNNQGYEFVEDKTLTPKANSNTVLFLKNALTLSGVNVTDGGSNYTSPPNITAVGNDSILAISKLQGNSVLSAEVIFGDSNLSPDLRLFPTNNSNGVTVIGSSSAFGENTLTLRAPILGFTVFPFEEGDEIFVENVKIIDGSGSGYNSADYDYQKLVVTGINTISGSESVTYAIPGVGATTGGSYDSSNTFGRVVKYDNLCELSPILDKVLYLEGEKVQSTNGDAYGFVAKNGWNPDNQTLKLINVSGQFDQNDIISGNINGYKSTVSSTVEYDFDLKVGSVVETEGQWQTDTGKLNLDTQRLHDSDYYQRFSYSIKGEVPYETWSEPVDSLCHTSGFKKFSNLEINNGIGNSVRTSINDTTINLDILVDSSASVHSITHYDLVSEDTDDPGLSKLVKLDSKIITDYIESRTNKVLMIDDLSSDFTGYTTSIGGQIVGLTTFAIYSDEISLLYHTFDPDDTLNSIITINSHNFITGEELKYSPTNNDLNSGTAIGIATTSSLGIGVGSTDLLPETVYAIKLSESQIKLAIGSSEALAGTAISFTSVTGIGSTHSLEVSSDLANTRSLITIDNVIQSPVSRKDIQVSLSDAVGIGSTIVYLNDISKITGNSLLKIEDEIIKVTFVGIGSTNSLNIIRGQMGTVAAAHTIGAGVTVLSGDYNIAHGNLYFKDAPYGNSDNRSTFSGRIFYKLNYDTNLIIDDISESFDGATDKFDLTSNSQQISGIQTSFGVILINNIFQKPFYGDVGSILNSDYQIVGTGQTIDFTGTTVEDLPRGGIINEFDVGIGSGYQVPRRALATAVISASGTIQSIGLSTGGSGYIDAPRVSIADTLGVGIGASIIASVTAGLVTSFTIAAAGSGYTSTNPPLVVIDEPNPYKDIPLSGGQGSGAKMDVVVGTGGSIITFDISNRGIGYEIGDILTLAELPFQVGIGTSNFEITVRNRYQNKFAGWTFGQLLELDSFDNLFNGVRRSFLLTRTITSKEYYSIVAQEGSGIELQNNLLIFLNDTLQIPGKDYTFNGGTRLQFTEAPRAGSKIKLYFYNASSSDAVEVDIDETIKRGDILTLQTQGTVPQQDDRVIYEVIAADTVETQTYSGVGIITDTSFTRPTIWTKQTSDTIIDGEYISKERDYLEPKIFPSTNIIASVASTDGKIYVKDTYLFSKVDNLGNTLNDVFIVGLGTEVVTEKLSSVQYAGDYGLIVGVGASSTGINTTSPMLEIDLIPHPDIYSNTPGPGEVSRPGISTGDYFVIENTILGDGVTSIDNNFSIVSVGNSFIDNVYYANNVTSIGSSGVRVSVNVQSISGIDTTSLPTLQNYGTFSWGYMTAPRSANSQSFDFYNQNGLLGIETSAHVGRLLQLRLTY